VVIDFPTIEARRSVPSDAPSSVAAPARIAGDKRLASER